MDWLFDIFSLKSIVTFVVVYSITSNYFSWKWGKSVDERIQKLEDKVFDLSSEKRELEREVKYLSSRLDKGDGTKC